MRPTIRRRRSIKYCGGSKSHTADGSAQGGALVMLTRRSILLGLGASSLPLSIGTRRAFAQASRPRLHAMIVGINTYKGRVAHRNGDQSIIYLPIPQLHGCINDARSIEAVVRPR